MQTFKNSDPIKASSILSSTQIRWQTAKDKETILAIVCTNTFTKSNEKIIIMKFLVFPIFVILLFASPYMVVFIGRSCNIERPYRVHHNY